MLLNHESVNQSINQSINQLWHRCILGSLRFHDPDSRLSTSPGFSYCLWGFDQGDRCSAEILRRRWVSDSLSAVLCYSGMCHVTAGPCWTILLKSESWVRLKDTVQNMQGEETRKSGIFQDSFRSIRSSSGHVFNEWKDMKFFLLDPEICKLFGFSEIQSKRTRAFRPKSRRLSKSRYSVHKVMY